MFPRAKQCRCRGQMLADISGCLSRPQLSPTHPGDAATALFRCRMTSGPPAPRPWVFCGVDPDRARVLPNLPENSQDQVRLVAIPGADKRSARLSKRAQRSSEGEN